MEDGFKDTLSHTKKYQNKGNFLFGDFLNHQTMKKTQKQVFKSQISLNK